MRKNNSLLSWKLWMQVSTNEYILHSLMYAGKTNTKKLYFLSNNAKVLRYLPSYFWLYCIEIHFKFSKLAQPFEFHGCTGWIESAEALRMLSAITALLQHGSHNSRGKKYISRVLWLKGNNKFIIKIGCMFTISSPVEEQKR